MFSPVQLFFEGGIFQFAVMPLGLIAILIALFVPGVIGLAKWRVPASVSLFGIVFTVTLGVLGTLVGMRQAWLAVAVASSDMKDAMMAAGGAIALYTTIMAMLFAIPAAIAACFSAAVPAVVAVGPEPRFDVRGILSAFAAAVAVFVVAAVALVAIVGANDLARVGPALPIGLFVCVVVTLLTVVSCARIASEDHEHQGRIAGSRFFVATCGALSLILVGELFRVVGLSHTVQAISMAPPEMVVALGAAGASAASDAAWLGWLLALVPLSAGTCGTLHWVRRVDGRVGVGAVVTILCAVLILVMVVVARSTALGEVTALG